MPFAVSRQRRGSTANTDNLVEKGKIMIFDETRENTVAKETQQREADDRADFDEPEHDGQPDEYTEWQDSLGMATRLFFSKN